MNKVDPSQFTLLPDGKVVFSGKTYKNLDTARSMEWVSRHKEHSRKYHHEYTVKNLERERKYRNERLKNDPAYRENKNAVHRKWEALNREKLRQRYRDNRDVQTSKSREYYQKHKLRISEHKKEYRKKNSARINHLVAKRAAKMKGPVKHSELIRAIYMLASSSEKKTCYYCQKDFTCPVHVDHVIPLAKGGPHSIENLCLACPKCNVTKNAKLPHELTMHSQKILTL